LRNGVEQVYDANGDQEVGKISKQWSGFVQEYFTDADNFGVNCKSSPLSAVHIGDCSAGLLFACNSTRHFQF